MSSEDREAQEDELLALASIYDGDEFRKAESVQGGETRIYLDLPQNFKIFVSEKLIDLRNEYLQADETNKRFLEQRYGKRVIQKALEEMESKEWLEKNSKSCPCCGTPIEKLDGCNKMTCTGCMQYFCWICMGSLSRANPYKHFTDPASPCFNRLFHAVDVNGEVWEDEAED
uniref:Ring finger protein 14 n=2 Tax=Sus scrofa TaxID=9823 RepID=A0A8D1ZQY5_PIG